MGSFCCLIFYTLMNDNYLLKDITHLYVPSSIETFDLLSNKQKKHADKYNYVLHSIYIARKIDKRNTAASYIPLSSKILGKVTHTSMCKSLLDFWINEGVIECDNQYIVGEKCKGYRFTLAYREEPVKHVAIKDHKFKAKLTKRKSLYMDRVDLSNPTLSFIHNNLMAVRIDVLGALKHTHQLFKVSDEHEDKFNQYCISIHEFAQGNYFFTRDIIGNRVHNNFVNFPKVLRPFIYLETGEQLVNLDISNSQPLMLCVLLMKYYKERAIPKDVVRYINECQEGIFYESFAISSGIPLESRKEFKEKLFANVFFGRNEVCIRSKAFKALLYHYPNVASFISEYKKKDYKLLAIALQKVESEIIIDDVIGGLASIYNPDDFFALTIHDSITTTYSNKEKVMSMMEEAFRKRGIKASIKPEFFEMKSSYSIDISSSDKLNRTHLNGEQKQAA